MGLRQWWAQLTGGRGWDREVARLHNTLDDETPAPGVPINQDPHVPVVADTLEPRTAPLPDYKEWPGPDPGH
jgi:hypothetical protein